MASSREPFLYTIAHEASTEIYPKAELGKPCHIHRFSWTDLGAVGVAMVAFTIAMVAAFNKGTAINLGQTAQLIVLGVMLAFMGACSRGCCSYMKRTQDPHSKTSMAFCGLMISLKKPIFAHVPSFSSYFYNHQVLVLPTRGTWAARRQSKYQVSVVGMG